jgi:hypothetical protein
MDGLMPPVGDESIRVLVSVPITRIGVGVFSLDPVEQLLGAPLADLLEPLRVGSVERRPSSSGTAVEVHPLALPEGEGLAIPLGQFGEVALKNDHGLLALTVPAAWSARLSVRLGTALVRGPERVRSLDGGSEVVTCWARLRPGMRAALPLGALGELTVAVASRC